MMNELPVIHFIAEEPAQNRHLGELFVQRGYRVSFPDSVEEALLQASKNPPDLLICEANGSSDGGAELCRRFKQDPRTLHTSVMLLSPVADAEAILAGLRAGADEFLVGTYEPEALAERVDSFLSGRREPVETEKRFVQDRAESAGRCPSSLPLDRANCENEKMGAVARLASVVAHDFNNKLMAIKGYADILDLSMGSEDANRQFVLEIGKAIQQAREITDQLTLVAGRARHEIGAVDVAELLEELHPLLTQSIGPNVLLDLGHPSGVGNVAAESTLLKQAILNLCLNARDAMPDGGQLAVEAKETGSSNDRDANGDGSEERVVIEVRDSGTGMSEDMLPHIFEPYYTTKEKRAGLGLTMVYVTMKELGGRIECSSVPGSGTTFRLFLKSFDRGESMHARI